jgi:hypothetical protein
MKSMAMTTFIVFTLAILARGFSQYNSKVLYTKVSQHSPRLFDEQNKDLLRAELSTLSDVYIETQNSNSTAEMKIARERFVPDLKELEHYYFESFIENYISFDDTRSRQNEIVELKIEAQMNLLPTDTYDIFLIYYLLIVEGMSLGEINQIRSLYELFPEDPELATLTKFTMSDQFAREVLSFLGADEYEYFDQESLALSLVPREGYHGDLDGVTYESSDWDQGPHRAFASEEQEAIYRHLQEFRISPDEVRELVQGYQVSLPRF